MQLNEEQLKKVKQDCTTLTDLDKEQINHLAESADALFPLHVFPIPVLNYLIERRDKLSENEDYLILAATISIAAALGSNKKSYFLYENKPIFWGGIIGPTGIGKSTPVSAMLKPFYETQNQALMNYENEKGRLEEENIKNKKKHPDPICKFYITTDLTIEGLAKMHKLNPDGIVVHYDEMLGLVNSFGAYKGGKGNDQQTFLQLHDGNGIYKVRAITEAVGITETCVNIIGGLQPEVIPIFFKDSRLEDGFVFRYLYAFEPNYSIGPVKRPGINKVIEDDYVDYIKALMSENSEQKIEFTLEAEDIYSYWNFYCRHLYEENQLMRSYQAKLDKYVHRFALIIHITNQTPFEQKISKETMSSAIQAVEYYRRHFKNMIDYVNKDYFQRLSLNKQDLYLMLPEQFKRKEVEQLINSLSFPTRTFTDFLADNKLFTKIKQGEYKKKWII